MYGWRFKSKYRNENLSSRVVCWNGRVCFNCTLNIYGVWPISKQFIFPAFFFFFFFFIQTSQRPKCSTVVHSKTPIISQHVNVQIKKGVGEGEEGGGGWRLLETEKNAQNLRENRKMAIKIAQNRKTAGHYDQNSKFT